MQWLQLDQLILINNIIITLILFYPLSSTLPIDDQILGDLVDLGGGRIGNRNIAFAGGHHTALWIGISGTRMKGKK